jgi:hypothetical protein
VKRTEMIKNDLRHLWDAFIKVYPMTFRKIINHWQITIAAIFAIGWAFYFDPDVRVIITGIENNVIDYMFSFGRWYGSWEAPLYLLELYI